MLNNQPIMSHPPHKQFGLTPTRYWQEINRLINTPAAHQHNPALARRLTQARKPRTRLRTRLI